MCIGLGIIAYQRDFLDRAKEGFKPIVAFARCKKALRFAADMNVSVWRIPEVVCGVDVAVHESGNGAFQTLAPN